jgi:hypothetical protein
VLVGWRYKAVDKKPVIINAASKQTVIPPHQVAKPALPPPSPPVSITAASALYEDMKTRFQASASWAVVHGPVEDGVEIDAGNTAKRCFIAVGVAERKFTGRRNRVGARSDRDQAYDVDSLLYGGPTLDKYLALMLSRAEDLICGPGLWPQVELGVADLLKHWTLTEEQVRDIKGWWFEGLSNRGAR